MPLKPALSTIHPRNPQPREVRKVGCPHCGHAFEISTRAMSVRCPGCTRPLEFKDLTLRQKLEGDIQTMGRVGVEGPGEMIGRLVCGTLTNEGRFEGQVICYGEIELLPHSLTTGEIAARALKVERGATLRARAQIGVKQKVSPTARLLSYRPLRRITKRTPGSSAAPLATIASSAPATRRITAPPSAMVRKVIASPRPLAAAS